ncbi:MAG: hypothetical protein U0T75_01645 [Chitinophagales bacterium]
MNPKIDLLQRRVRLLVLFFMVALVFSGLTAIPVLQELNVLLDLLPSSGKLTELLFNVRNSLLEVNNRFGFLQYGFDWLAFAHLVIAVAFVGVLRNPVRNIWVLEFGLIACVMVLPFALIMGGFRGLPLWWRLIDCSFGVVGFFPLWFARKAVLQLEAMQAEDRLNTIF